MSEKTVEQKLAEQARGIKYGCHVDLAEDEAPDGCVIDYGTKEDCIYATRRRKREGCRFWQPAESKDVDA